MFNKKIVIIIAAVLVAGFAFGAFFGGGAGLTDWAEDDEPAGVADVPGEEDGFEEARPQLEQQLRQQRENEILMEHVEELRGQSDVETHLDVFGEGDESAVVATVNGEEILKEELVAMEEQQKQQLAMQGMDPDGEEAEQMMEEMRPQILDNIIAINLLEQEAQEEGISVEEDEVDEHYQQFAQQAGGEEMLAEQLEEAGITEEELKSDIGQQLLVEQYMEFYIEENVDEEELEFTEEELRELYEQQQQQMEQQMQLEEEMEIDGEQ